MWHDGVCSPGDHEEKYTIMYIVSEILSDDVRSTSLVASTRREPVVHKILPIAIMLL